MRTMLLAVVLLAGACSVGGPVPTSLSEVQSVNGVKPIDARTLAAWMEAGRKPFLLDVRTPGEFASGHIEGALNVPIDQLNAAIADLPKDQPVYVLCESGARSKAASMSLARAGFEVVDVTDGMGAWRWTGQPVVR